jgi:uncharacterized protein DUF1844
MSDKMEASFSILAMSIASSAVMAMGLAPDPQSGKIMKDKNMARFNIDLLMMLQDKTKNNLTKDEQQFLENIVNDLQVKFVQS